MNEIGAVGKGDANFSNQGFSAKARSRRGLDSSPTDIQPPRGILGLEQSDLREGRDGNPRVIAQLENPVAKILWRQHFQNPFEFQKNGGPVGLFEGNDDDAVVFGKKPGNRVEEIAVCCQQDRLLLLRPLKDGTVVRSLLGQFKHPACSVAFIFQEIHDRFREIFVEEKIHAAA